jgi:hypothetical protein
MLPRTGLAAVNSKPAADHSDKTYSGSRPNTEPRTRQNSWRHFWVHERPGRVELRDAGDQEFRFGLADSQSGSAATRPVSATNQKPG